METIGQGRWKRSPAGKSIDIEVTFGEANLPIDCNLCGVLHRAGFFVRVRGQMCYICVRCTATYLNKYCKDNNEPLLNTEIYVEAPDLKEKVEEYIDLHLVGYKIKDKDRSALARAIQDMFDFDFKD